MKTIDLLYVAYEFTVSPRGPWSDVLVAQLGDAGFDSFIDTDTGVTAYILKSLDHDNVLDHVDLMQFDGCSIAFAKADVPPTNWNHEWEKNFEPIIVDNRCEIRAPFHESRGLDYEIIIEPKMSFGTGHHQTTHMMLQYLLTHDLKDLHVLDMGSGTGVLAIMAKMRGATSVDAIDIDTWCYENALENVARNHVDSVQVILGGAEQLQGKLYDFIIANINRNILLEDIPAYEHVLKSGGTLLLSGFYEEDITVIKAACEAVNIHYDMHLTRDNWVAVKLLKMI